MAYTTSMNNGATSSQAHQAGLKSLAIQALQPTDWTPIERANNRLVLMNTGNSDYSVPNRVRIERSQVSNIYEGSGITSNYQMPTKRGIKLFAQTTCIASLRNSADITDVLLLPYVASVTIRVPNVPTDIVSYANVASVLQQLYGVFAISGSNTSAAFGDSLAGFLNGNLDLTTKVYG